MHFDEVLVRTRKTSPDVKVTVILQELCIHSLGANKYDYSYMMVVVRSK